MLLRGQEITLLITQREVEALLKADTEGFLALDSIASGDLQLVISELSAVFLLGDAVTVRVCDGIEQLETISACTESALGMN